MIKGLIKTISEVSIDESFLTGGDFWVPVALTWIFAYVELFCNVHFNIEKIYGDIISMLSIMIGFSITNIIFLMQTVTTWKQEYEITACKIIRWSVFPLLVMILTIFYVVFLDIMASAQIAPFSDNTVIVQKAILVFLSSYSLTQVFCEVLTLWWTFKRRHSLHRDKGTNDQAK